MKKVTRVAWILIACLSIAVALNAEDVTQPANQILQPDIDGVLNQLGVFVYAVKQEMLANNLKELHSLFVDRDFVRETKKSKSIMMQTSSGEITVVDPKNFIRDYRFLIEKKRLTQFPLCMQERNVKPYTLFFPYFTSVNHIEGTYDAVDFMNFGVSYYWPFACKEADEEFRKLWFKGNYPTPARNMDFSNKQSPLVNPKAFYDPSNGLDSAGFIYVDIHGNHSPHKNIKPEIIKKIKELK